MSKEYKHLLELIDTDDSDNLDLAFTCAKSLNIPTVSLIRRCVENAFNKKFDHFTSSSFADDINTYYNEVCFHIIIMPKGESNHEDWIMINIDFKPIEEGTLGSLMKYSIKGYTELDDQDSLITNDIDTKDWDWSEIKDPIIDFITEEVKDDFEKLHKQYV